MKAVHFGAGSIGRGFIGQLLHDSGYDIVMVDVNTALVNRINAHQGYDLYLINHAYQKVTIDHVTALSATQDSQALIEAIVSADLITTSVWADNLAQIAPVILKGLVQRQHLQKSRLNILACENAFMNGQILHDEILKADTQQELIYLDAVAAFPNTVVDRMVLDYVTAGQHSVAIGDSFELAIESSQLVDPKTPPIVGAEYTQNLQKYLERKLYIINCGHAWAGYIGYVLGCNIIQDVFARADLVQQVRQTMEESARLLVRKYDFTAADLDHYIDFAIDRYQTPGIKDPIARVCRSPIRKLGPQDRLVAPAVQLEQYGLPNELLLKGIAAALLFFNPQDEQCVILQKYLTDHGLPQTIEHFTAISTASPAFKKIMKSYDQQRQLLAQHRDGEI